MNIDAFPGSESSGSNMAPAYSQSLGSFEQDVMMMQNQALTQAVLNRLAELSFDRCIERPSSSLSSSEKACIYATSRKFIDTSELVVGKLTGQS